MPRVYILTSGKYGNPGPYYTTLAQFEADLAGMASQSDDFQVPTLYERETSPKGSKEWYYAVTDDDGDTLLIEATPANIEQFSSIDDPYNLV